MIVETKFDDKVELTINVDLVEEVALEHAELASELNLDRLAEMDMAEATKLKAEHWLLHYNIDWLPSIPRSELELFYSRTYTTRKGKRYYHEEPMSEYNHRDGVPLEVRILMKEATPYFDYLEIRTPERVNIDPALFGIVQTRDGVHKALLARWGEDSLISQEGIHELIEIARPSWYEHDSFRFIAVVVAGISSIAFGVSLLVGDAAPHAEAMTNLSATTIWVFLTGFALTINWKRKLFCRKNPDLKAHVERLEDRIRPRTFVDFE